MHFSFIFWFFFLIWKTFLFKFGLLGKLMKREFPILLIVPLNFIFFLIDTFLRIVRRSRLTLFKYYCLLASEKSNVVTIYNNWIYHIFFWIRHACKLDGGLYSSCSNNTGICRRAQGCDIHCSSFVLQTLKVASLKC